MDDRDQDIPAYSYQARRGRPALDPAMRRMALGAGVLSVLVIGVALVWSGMRPGGGFGPVPEISAPPGPLRVAPAEPGGLTVPGANEQIMSGDNPDAPPQLAPAAQGPALAQLQQAANGGLPVAAAPAQPAPVPAPSAAPAPDAPAASKMQAAAGQVQVQLAASVDEAGVKRAWFALKTKMPNLLGKRVPVFAAAVVDGQTIWRLRLGGFADDAAARGFCAAVVAKGEACTVAAF